MMEFIEQVYRNEKNYKGIVFLDRDGTLNKEVTYLSHQSQLEILPSVIEGITLLNSHNIAAVVITNQPVVARGIITINSLKKINDYFVSILAGKHAYIDAVYSCPHHPEKDHLDIPKHARKFRLICECRKPGLAMYQKAMSEYRSKKLLGVIGDQSRDINAGKKLSIPTVLVLTGLAGKETTSRVMADFVCNNFFDASVTLIKSVGI